MLFNQSDLILVKMFEYVIVIQQVFIASFILIFHIFINKSISFIVEFLRSLFYIVKSIKGIHELYHTFRILLLLLHIAFYKIGEWEKVEGIFIQLF